MEIGNYLRKLRDAMAITSRQLAERAGVSQSTYMDWEHDKTSPSLKSYVKIAEAFQLGPVEMMAYLTDQISKPSSSEEKNSIKNLKEMVTYYMHYTELLREEKERLERELSSILEMSEKKISVTSINETNSLKVQ